MAKEKRPYGTPRIEIRNGYKYAECAWCKQGQNWNGFRKEKTYEEEKRSESTEEPAASEHGN